MLRAHKNLSMHAVPMFVTEHIICRALLCHKNDDESHYQHSISNAIGIAKILFFTYKLLLKKIEHLYLIHFNLALVSL